MPFPSLELRRPRRRPRSASLGGKQLADREQRAERQPALLEDLARALLAIDHGEHPHDLGLVRLRGLDGDECALAAGDHVVEDRDTLVTGEIALDLSAQSVILGVAAHEESLDRLADF